MLPQNAATHPLPGPLALEAASAIKPGQFKLERRERISLNREAERIIESGRRTAGNGFVLYWCDQSVSLSPLSGARMPSRRISVRVSRDFGSAPRRNRAKRIVREIFRLEKHRLRERTDIIIKIRPLSNPEDLSFNALRPRILELCASAGILEASAS